MPLHKTVTAQDFVDAVGRVVQDGHFATDQKMEVYPILQALLSRARQEAAEEMKSKLEEIYSECQRRDNERHKLALLKFGKEARREALKEAMERFNKDGLDEIITAAHNYQSDMSKWNGDEDGPAERAEERLGDAVDTVIKNLLDNA